MTNKNRSAVEFLYERLEAMIPRTILYTIDKKIYFQEALAMEKEQMIKFANDFLFHDDTDLTAEQYYNENYGN
jgi:hypothetical protein